MAETAVRYAKSGDVHVAFQVVGDGPIDVVFVWGGISHLELGWEHPPTAEFLDELSTWCRLILLDKRGTGLSDRVPFASNLADRMDDVRAVMDAAGSEQAFVIGESEAAGLVCSYAAMVPERVAGIVLYAPLVRVIAADDFPWAHSAEAFEQYIEASERHWGDGLMMSLHSPSTAHDELHRRYWGRLERQAMSPGGFVDHMRVITDIDVRAVLPSINRPTLVVHRTGDPTVPIGQGRYVAAHVPGARLVELPGTDHYPMVGDAASVLDAIRTFISGGSPTPGPSPADRVLTTVVFTDIVQSTERLAQVGDRRWHDLIDDHDRTAAAEIARYRGRLLRTTGDGVLATFDGPARAVKCAATLARSAERLGLQVRAGVHTGEVELRGDDITGIAVHTAARVQAEAAPGEVLVSRTVVDLVAGSDLAFTDRGERSLRGVPGQWRLFALSA